MMPDTPDKMMFYMLALMLVIVPVVGILITAITGYIAVQMSRMAVTVSTVATDVLRVEKATNSHTDLLVEATRLAAHAAGQAQERTAQAARDAVEKQEEKEKAQQERADKAMEQGSLG